MNQPRFRPPRTAATKTTPPLPVPSLIGPPAGLENNDHGLDRIDDSAAERSDSPTSRSKNIMRLERDIFALAATENDLANSPKPLFVNIRSEGVRIA